MILQRSVCSRCLKFYIDKIMEQLACRNDSVGYANKIFSNLLSTIVAAQCLISPPSMWPNDYQPKTTQQNGKDEQRLIAI